MNPRVFGDPLIFRFGPIPVTETMAATLGVSLSIIFIAAVVRAVVVHRPTSPAADVAMLVVSWFEETVSTILGRGHRWVEVLGGTLFLFIATCNLAGQLPGVTPPTASLATTSALAMVVFLSVPIIGIRERGLREYARHYFAPNPLLFPLHLVSEVSRTVALAIRLFGNIMSGHLVVGLLVALAGFLVPVPFMALDLLIGLLQAYIFTILTIVFIGGAIGAGGDS